MDATKQTPTPCPYCHGKGMQTLFNPRAPHVPTRFTCDYCCGSGDAFYIREAAKQEIARRAALAKVSA